MDTGFYRNKHNPDFFSGTAQTTLSLFSEENALKASAYLNASGTAMLQLDGRPPGLYAEISGVYGNILRSGDTSASETSNRWFMPQVDTSKAHIFPYATDIADKYLSSAWSPTAR